MLVIFNFSPRSKSKWLIGACDKVALVLHRESIRIKCVRVWPEFRVKMQTSLGKIRTTDYKLILRLSKQVFQCVFQLTYLINSGLTEGMMTLMPLGMMKSESGILKA